MTGGLVLATLIPTGTGRYSTGKAILDVWRLTNAMLRLQTVQALDLGFQCRARSALLSATCDALEVGNSHGVTFYDVAAQAVAGTSAP